MCINPFWNWFWLFLFLLSLSCNKSNSFLISSISFCMLFYCKFGIFILYMKKKKKNLNWGGKFFYNFFHYKNSIYFLDGSCNNSIYSLDGCSWPLVSTKLPCEKPDAWAFILFIYFFLNAQASRFLIRSHVNCGTLCHAIGHSHSYQGIGGFS